MNVAVRETGDTVVFLHRLEAGGTDRSYGIHVAQLAGLPTAVVARAKEVLLALEDEHRVVPGKPRRLDEGQLILFGEARPAQPIDEMRDEIAKIDVDALTPLEALNRLADLKHRAEQSR